MSYSRILRRIIGDGARSNRFAVKFNDFGNFAKDLNFICTSASLPSIQTTTADYKYKGHSVTVPIGCKYVTDLTMDFYLDEEHKIKKFFDEWIEMYDTRGENISMSGKQFQFVKMPNGDNVNDFTCTVDIEQFTFDENMLNINAIPSVRYRLYNVFPTNVGSISLDDNDSIEKLQVTFKFSYYERI